MNNYERIYEMLVEYREGMPLTKKGQLKQASTHAKDVDVAAQARGGKPLTSKQKASATGTRAARLKKLGKLSHRYIQIMKGGAPRTHAGAKALGDYEGKTQD